MLEEVYWLDCGFYLFPVTVSKLAKYGLKLEDVEVKMRPPKRFAFEYSRAPNERTFHSSVHWLPKVKLAQNDKQRFLLALGGSLPKLRSLFFA
tara:strand:- start:493 stop:771 length:279 start_codon:yes stop_codon:yes gene_type:complete